MKNFRRKNPFLVISGKEGEPLWPKGLTGSISHTKGLCCAILAQKKHFISIGIDVENKRNKNKRGIRDLVLNQDEKAWLKLHPDPALMGLLIFSAKESVFKAFFPIIKERFSFDAVSIIPSPKGSSFRIWINRDLGPLFQEGMVFGGLFFVTREYIFTFAGIPAKPAKPELKMKNGKFKIQNYSEKSLPVMLDKMRLSTPKT